MKFKVLIIIFLNLLFIVNYILADCPAGSIFTCTACCGSVPCTSFDDGSKWCMCNVIYEKFNDATKTCQDINECLSSNGGCQQTCTDKLLGWTCGCNSGYTLNADGKTCDNINECLSSNGGCQQTCTDSAGSYSCSCSAGYTLNVNGKTCDNINECATSNGGCQQTCTDSAGSYSCSCSTGYKLNANGKSCDLIDEDECATGNNNCQQICTNTVGSYTCSCNTGYTKSGSYNCIDINECLTNNGGCQQNCTNSVGSFSCSCNAGYTKSGTFNCIDINECLTNNGGCQQNCTNTVGSFSCSCNDGYTKSGTYNCIDIDECSTNPSICGSASCQNTVPGYSCNCPTGFTFNSTSKSCDDVNECSITSICGSALCKNTDGSYQCYCNSGYSYNSTTKNCDVIVGECATANCQQICNNNVGGGHTCSCNDGYRLNGDGKTCDDINECSEGTSGCEQKCINTDGSVTCYCDAGYNLNANGKLCDDINECMINNGDCVGGECMNKPGTYQCVCPIGFVLGSNLKNCQDINECIEIPNVCGSYPNCTNTVGSFNCSGTFQHTISSVIPSNENGGEAIFKGSFGDIHENAKLTIGGIDCPISLITSSIINCNASPGKGKHSVTLTQNALVYTSGEIYLYQPVGGDKSCYKDCTDEKHGTCDTQNNVCLCKDGYSGFDCSTEVKPNNPGSEVIIGNGTTEIINQEVNFQIYFKSLNEIDYNGQIYKSFNLQEKWFLNNSYIQDGNNKYIFVQTIQDNCKITSIIEEIKQDKQFSFAGTDFTLKSGLIKFTITISNYQYSNFLNTLRLDLISSVGESEINSNNQCNSKDTLLETDDSSLTFNYIKISKNNKLFSARLLNKLLSDGEATYLSTSIQKNESQVIVSLYFPNCKDCIIDPDFSVLVSPDFKENCEKNRKWVIPVAVVVSIVGAAIIGTAVFLILRKNTTARIAVAKLKKIKRYD